MARHLSGTTARSWTISISNTPIHSGRPLITWAMIQPNAANRSRSVTVIIIVLSYVCYRVRVIEYYSLDCPHCRSLKVSDSHRPLSRLRTDFLNQFLHLRERFSKLVYLIQTFRARLVIGVWLVYWH